MHWISALRDVRPGDWIRYGTRDSSWCVVGRVLALTVNRVGTPAAVVDVDRVEAEDWPHVQPKQVEVWLSKDFDLKEIVYGQG